MAEHPDDAAGRVEEGIRAEDARIGREFIERLAGVELRLDVLDQARPKNSLRLKPTDGHHHMEPVRLLDDGTDKGFGFELDFKNSTVVRGTLAENRKFTITPGGGLGFCYDYFVDELYTGTEGATVTIPNSTFTFKRYSTIQGAVDDAEGVNGTKALSFLLCGAFSENVTINMNNIATAENLWFYGIELENGTEWGNSSSGDALTLSGSSGAVLYFDTIRFLCPTSSASVEVAGTPEMHFERCYFRSAVKGSFSKSSFTDCRFLNLGFLIESGDSPGNVTFDHCFFTVGANGLIWAAASDMLVFDHCQFTSTDKPIQITGGAHSNMKFDHCRFFNTTESPGRAFLVNGSVTIKTLTFNNCSFDEPKDSNGAIFFQSFTSILNLSITGGCKFFKDAGVTFPFIVNGHTTAIINAYIAGNIFGRDGSSQFYVETEDSAKFSVSGEFDETIFGPNAPAGVVNYSITDNNSTNEFYPPNSAIGTSQPSPTQTSPHGIAQHTEHAADKALYTDNSGDEQEIALGADGTYYRSAGATSTPAFVRPLLSEIFTFSTITALTLVSDVIQLPAAPFGLIAVTSQAGATDDLVDIEINGGGTTLVPGTQVLLTNTSGDAITLKHDGAKLILSLAVDVTLVNSGRDMILFQAISSSIWVEVWRSASLMPVASLTVQGKVELATAGETTTGTDPDKAVTPDGLNDASPSLAELTVRGGVFVGGTGASFNIAVTLEDPTASEDFTLFHGFAAYTIQEIEVVLVGSSSQTVTWTLRHNADRSATGTEVVTSGTTTTNITTGDNITSFNDATVPIDNFLWLETTAQGGTVSEFHLTLRCTWD